MIPDIAMPAVRRLADRGASGREHSNGTRYTLLVNGDRGGYLGYATWRKYLNLAHGYTAAHQMGHSRIETTKNIYTCSPRTAASS